MCEVATRNHSTDVGECLPFLKDLIMEVSEDRGIECQGVCFDFIDGKIVLSIYQNLPGIKRHLAGTTFLKAFTIDDWKAVNRYLMDVIEPDIIEIDSEGNVHPPEAVSILSGIRKLRDEVEEVPTIHSQRTDTSVNKIPKMTSPVPGMENKEEEEGNDGKE